MDKIKKIEIKPVNLILSSLCILLLSFFGLYYSIINYIDYFLMKDRIAFSFQTGLLCFGVPLTFYFSYYGFLCAYKKKIQKMNNKIAGYLAIIAIAGIVFSFFFSFYVRYDLVSKGYYICYKQSIFAPSEYVISKDMCK
ncbi:DUF1240 domain-containing protein [Proteus appendicitidis]|uniref:DUF1240 domain-containing protein n=1 Tax=Proteus appendicitidis TaxID=3034648 RepID=A0ABY8Y9X0_9GAMM|nr:DUF1240 domain-containing protein [Proteus sp. HZ0627]WIV88716.1 DUF1240 domain-containing protein [Proteus sp. HZ0627]